MRTRIDVEQRDNQAEESGLSIVEVIVALMLLGIGILGASASFTSARKATSNSLHRSQASHLAVAEIERARTVPYSEVAMDTNSADYEGNYAGRATVAASVSTPTTSTLQPSTTVPIGNESYDVRVHLTWQPLFVDGNTVAEGYKVINVIVRWSDSAGSHDIELGSGLYDRTSG